MNPNVLTRLLTMALVLVLALSVWNCKSETEQPTPSGNGGSTGSGSGSTGGGSTAQTGMATFFTKEDLGVGVVSVYVDGKLEGTISHYHAGGVTCGQGDVNVTKPAGTYAFKATGGTSVWNGTITIKNGGCQPQELAKGTSGGGTSGGGTSGGGGNTTAQGQVTFWTAQTSGWSSIDVSVGGSYVGAITKYSASAPACGTSGFVTVAKAPGTYAFTAKSKEGDTWTGDVKIDANACNTYQLTFKANSGGGSNSTTCDWDAWNKLVTVTRWEYKNNFCTEGQTLVSVRNDANVNMDIQFCIQGPDGVWKSHYGLNTKPGGYLIGPDFWLCGKAKGYRFWARPTSRSSTCAYPNCN